MTHSKPRIAVLAGPTATILNSPPLVTSNKARRRRGLPERTDPWGAPFRHDPLRPQRLARPVTVYVEQFSAHPLERDVADLYAEPDGYLDAEGAFHTARTDPADTPVYEIELRPEDGLLPLPYMALRRDGTAWEAKDRAGDEGRRRQTFYPDAARLFEEIDRVAIDAGGDADTLGAMADYDFFRVLPPGGYTRGLAEADRTDRGAGNIPVEQAGIDFFPYGSGAAGSEPSRSDLAHLTNRVTGALADGGYAGAIWLEGSPFVEETIYWINLLIDVPIPIVACAAPDLAHGVFGEGGGRNIVDAVRYIRSGIWADDTGRDRVGSVLVSSRRVFAARDVQKVAGRPDGYVAGGGHGGVVATLDEPGPPALTYIPVRLHTHRSDVRASLLPSTVHGVALSSGEVVAVPVQVRDDQGRLRAEAIPVVTIYKHGRFMHDGGPDPSDELVELLARVRRNLDAHPLAGFVIEGGTPHGKANNVVDAVMRRATFSGMPVVRTGRGNVEGFASSHRAPLAIGAGNLTSPKARILLMACLLRFGALPVASDPEHPTPGEIDATASAVARFQAVFDAH